MFFLNTVWTTGNVLIDKLNKRPTIKNYYNITKNKSFI